MTPRYSFFDDVNTRFPQACIGGVGCNSLLLFSMLIYSYVIILGHLDCAGSLSRYCESLFDVLEPCHLSWRDLSVVTLRGLSPVLNILLQSNFAKFLTLIVLFGLQHCSGINCVTGPNGLKGESGGEYLFSGSRDGTLKRWELGAGEAVCGATFESHVDWVFTYTTVLHIAYSCLFRRVDCVEVSVFLCEML